MDDYLVNLSILLSQNRGVYAVLLGSGVSRAASIPTGWEILEDLANKVAELYGEPGVSDLATWYSAKFGESLTYSGLLTRLAPKRAERGALLRAYFEPSDQERSTNRKTPTGAHRAIARLVRDGVVRVIVTTNFDRLMEVALEDVGISPSVISSADDALGALPLVHSACTVVKVNGDYLDGRIRNTSEELGKYDASMRALMRRIFDEYGVIACGWSAEYDTGLSNIWRSAPNRRFSAFICYRTQPSTAAKDLADKIGAQLIQIDSSDAFFEDLETNIQSAQKLLTRRPISAKIAAENVKQYIVEDKYRIKLHDLIHNEVESLFEKLGSEGDKRAAEPKHSTVTDDLMKRYEAASSVAMSLLVTGAMWGGSGESDLWTYIVERTCRLEPYTGGYVALKKLNQYVSMRLFHAGLISAIFKNNLELFVALMTTETHVEGHRHPAYFNLYTDHVINDECWKVWSAAAARTSANGYRNPGEYLFANLRSPLLEYIPNDDVYRAIVCKVDYIVSLAAGDLAKEAQGQQFDWVYGNLWTRKDRRTNELYEEWLNRIGQRQPEWTMLTDAGMFGGKHQRLIDIAAFYNERRPFIQHF